MDKQLEDWLAECIGKGTFENKKDALEFCVGAVRAYCIMNKINQAVIASNEHPKLGDDALPLKWSHWKSFFEAAIKDHDKTIAEFRMF